LKLKDATDIIQVKSGNDIILKIDTAKLPVGFRRYEWSFLVNNSETFTVNSSDPDLTWSSSSVNTFGGLVNLRWDKTSGAGLKSGLKNSTASEGYIFYQDDLSFNVFPNPAKTYINVTFVNKVNEWSYWRIIDLSGRLHKEGRFLEQTSENDGKTMRIELNLKPGLYLLECSNALKCETVEFLVQ
jgi:hypothetical protein